MAETIPRPALAELPEPYATWQRQVEDAKAVLDGLLLHGISTSNADMAYGCLSFMACTLSTVRIAYQVRHAKEEGAVEYDISHAHGIGTLAVQLLEQDARGAGGKPVHAWRIRCRCTGCAARALASAVTF